MIQTDRMQNVAPWARNTKRAMVIYWTTTAIVCFVMVFGAVNFNLSNPVGPMKGGFAHLGFPNYFKIEVTIAKLLGAIALMLPNVPAKVKGFAYAGVAITLVSASIAHFSSGDGIMFIIDPLIFLGFLIVSYVHFNKVQKSNAKGIR